MATMTLADTQLLARQLANARALPENYPTRDHALASLELLVAQYIDELLMENVEEADPRMIELRSL